MARLHVIIKTQIILFINIGESLPVYRGSPLASSVPYNQTLSDLNINLDPRADATVLYIDYRNDDFHCMFDSLVRRVIGQFFPEP